MSYAKKATDLLVQMNDCHQNLETIFAEHPLDNNLNAQLKQVESYYDKAFHRAENKSAKIRILQDYNRLILILKQTSFGIISSDHALNLMAQRTTSYQIEIIIHNLIIVCELLFWAATSALFYFSCISVGIPLILVDPICGLMCSLCSALLLMSSMNNGLACFAKFKTFDPLNNEAEREKNLLCFFNTCKARSNGNTPAQEQTDQSASLSCTLNQE
ncbi:DUF5638 domain-containing protein [Legionella worsleiensis]|uniref:DUF5638 domain-containing protein n=1 Tax=Legionella worsleiensis TaxID=45076 RepID=A0A0W1A389_9GAMM|nr:DUF5638 domain-containing protein [Legionella worsleiensis]KTD75831.1 hypothetical protein Lwor_2397 [Legionella worsleiensis]STY32843.1 Uncharacterised protein [Legionella worsleiensis]